MRKMHWLGGSSSGPQADISPVNPSKTASPFFHPLLPIRLPTLPPAPIPPRAPPSPGHPFTCALPALGSPAARPPHAVGYKAHGWADHGAALSAPTPRGHRLFLQRWLPWRVGRGRASNAVGVVHIIHGLGDHSAKYAGVARELVKAGYAVLAHDAHGHGRSDGLRGHADSVMDYVCDARIAIEEGDRRLPRRYAGKPRFLLGHSLGGAVAIHLANRCEEREWAGVMLTAPAVQVYPKPLLKLFAPVLATLAPLMPVQRLKFDRRRRKGGKKKEIDPLVHRAPVRARLGYEVLKSCENIMKEAGRFRVPVLVAHSRGDRVTDAKGSGEFTKRVGSKDKTLLIYEGKAHDLLVDGEKQKIVVRDVVAWADKRAAMAVTESMAQEGKLDKGQRLGELKRRILGKAL